MSQARLQQHIDVTGLWRLPQPGSHKRFLRLQLTLQLKELAPLPFITMGETFYPGSRAWLQRVCETAGFIPKVAHEVDRAPTMIGLVSLGMGVTLLPETCMKLPHEGAVFRPLAEPVKTRIEIVWREHNLSRPLQHFIEIVRERFAASQ